MPALELSQIMIRDATANGLPSFFHVQLQLKYRSTGTLIS
jgi:hypothetical protein